MSPRLSSIDALRGFAALWVASYHLWNGFAPDSTPQTEPIPVNRNSPSGVLATFPFFAYGYAGVGLFFVLSGFCIHLPYARRFHATGSDRFACREFFRRRFWRLYPAYVGSLFLAAVALAAMTLAGNDSLKIRDLTGPDWVELLGLKWLLTNAFFLLPAQPQALAFNGVLWTLVYELQFYLLYPLLLPLCRRWGFGRIGVALLVCELLFLSLPTPTTLQSWAPHFLWFFLRRYFEWFLGMWLAERFAAGQMLSRRQAGWLLGGGIGFGVLASGYAPLWPYHELLFAFASTGLLAWVLAPVTAPAAPQLPVRVLAGFGEFSYSIYLVHLPVFRLVFALESQLPVRSIWTSAAAGCCCAILVPLVARGLYLLLERPYLPGAKPNNKASVSAPTLAPVTSLA